MRSFLFAVGNIIKIIFPVITFYSDGDFSCSDLQIRIFLFIGWNGDFKLILFPSSFQFEFPRCMEMFSLVSTNAPQTQRGADNASFVPFAQNVN